MRTLLGLFAVCSLVSMSIGCGGEEDDKNKEKDKNAPKKVETSDGEPTGSDTTGGDTTGSDTKGDDTDVKDPGTGGDDNATTGDDGNGDTADNNSGGPSLDNPPLKDPTKTDGDS